MEAAAKSKIFELQAALVCGAVNSATLQECVDWLKPYQLEEVVEERVTEGNCGYPCCPRQIDNNNSSRRTLRYLLDEKEHFQEGYKLSFFCSPACKTSIETLSSNLLLTSVFSRPGAHHIPHESRPENIDSFLEILDGRKQSQRNRNEENHCHFISNADDSEAISNSSDKRVHVDKKKASSLRIGVSANKSGKTPMALSGNVVEKMDALPAKLEAMGEKRILPPAVSGSKTRMPPAGVNASASPIAAESSDVPLVVGLGVSSVAMPSNEDKVIWKEIFGTDFIDDDEQSEELLDVDMGMDGGVQENKTLNTLWDALDVLFESDAGASLVADSHSAKNGLEATALTEISDESRPGLAIHLLAQVQATHTMLARGLSSAERFLQMPMCLKSTEKRTIFAVAKGQLFGKLRLLSSSKGCPSLSSSQWTLLGATLVDAIARANNLHDSEVEEAEWSSLVYNLFRQLHPMQGSMSDSEIMLLRTYFD